MKKDTIAALVIVVGMPLAALLYVVYDNFNNMAFRHDILRVDIMMQNDPDIRNYVLENGFLDDNILSQHECGIIFKRNEELIVGRMKVYDKP